jgi:AraC-like DNA-binding protein
VDAEQEEAPVARSTVEHLRRARDLMDRHYSRPLDLDALAREAGFSRYHFARAFKQAYGETPGGYLSRRRVERAKDLLRSANLTVSEICLLVGFSSLGSFSARFHELVGTSPTDYRRHHVGRTGPPPIPGCFLLAWSRPGASGAGPSRPPVPDRGVGPGQTAIGEKPAAPAPA